MSLIEHVWDALDQCVLQRVPVPDNIQQLCTAIEEEWDNIPQATINSLNNSMQRICVALLEANGGHTKYWLVFRSTSLPFFTSYLWPADAYTVGQKKYLVSHQLCKFSHLKRWEACHFHHRYTSTMTDKMRKKNPEKWGEKIPKITL